MDVDLEEMEEGEVIQFRAEDHDDHIMDANDTLKNKRNITNFLGLSAALSFDCEPNQTPALNSPSVTSKPSLLESNPLMESHTKL